MFPIRAVLVLFVCAVYAEETYLTALTLSFSDALHATKYPIAGVLCDYCFTNLAISPLCYYVTDFHQGLYAYQYQVTSYSAEDAAKIEAALQQQGTMGVCIEKGQEDRELQLYDEGGPYLPVLFEVKAWPTVYRTIPLRCASSSFECWTCTLEQPFADIDCPWCSCSSGVDSCAGRCGLYEEDSCFCDDLCWDYYDCCPDYYGQCVSDGTCKGICNVDFFPGDKPCHCDLTCLIWKDCCADYYDECGVVYPYGSSGSEEIHITSLALGFDIEMTVWTLKALAGVICEHGLSLDASHCVYSGPKDDERRRVTYTHEFQARTYSAAAAANVETMAQDEETFINNTQIGMQIETESLNLSSIPSILSMDYETTTTVIGENTNTDPPTNMPSVHITTLMPTVLPSKSPLAPTEKPNNPPTLDPTNHPSLPFTNSPTNCVMIEDWTNSRADELCPGWAHHEYGVQLCDKYDNPDYRRRLEFALANQLWVSCDDHCLYDYDSRKTEKPHAFRWHVPESCYNVATGYYCIEEETDKMNQTHTYAATLCETTKPCVERMEWTPEVAESNCPDGYSNGDKGWGTARVCKSLVRLEDGRYDWADKLYSASFNRSLSNHIFMSCSSKCLYDIENEGVAYQWKGGDCWERQTDWACIKIHTSEYEWALNYVDESICPIPTPAPVITPCVELEQNWSGEIAEETCSADAMGLTKKGVDAVVCEGYEEYQHRLDYSLANRAFLMCDAWCVYDVQKEGFEAFIWKSYSECYNPVTGGLCITGNTHDRELMTDYIKNTLCESNATHSTDDCIPYHTWDEDRAEKICESSNEADKRYGVKVCDDATSMMKESSLNKSLANNFFTSCSSWCVYDYDTIMNNIQSNSTDYGGFVWKQTCWKWVTGWGCFSSFLSEFEAVSFRALQQCEVF